jgi:hypothetical protein
MDGLKHIPVALPCYAINACKRGVLRLLFLITALILLPACANLPVGHGHVELDENTDPRFTKSGTQGAIARLTAFGGNVYLNNRAVSQYARLMNNDRVHTGPHSLARIKFSGTFSDKCEQGTGIREFHKGKLLGTTRTCRHIVETGNGHIEAAGAQTEYHIHTYPQVTELTVIKGSALAGPANNPAIRVMVHGKQEILMQGGSITGPRPVSDQQIKARIKWARINVPSVIGMQQGDAEKKLSATNLETGHVRLIANTNKRNTGLVQKQDPYQGTDVPYGTPVNLWIWDQPPRKQPSGTPGGSTQPAPVYRSPATVVYPSRSPATVKPVKTPNVVGMEYKKAVGVLKTSKMKVGKVTRLNNIGGDASFVKRQSPSGGSMVNPGTQINLWIKGVIQ